MQAGTPKFPLHPEGYSPEAPDALPIQSAKKSTSESK